MYNHTKTISYLITGLKDILRVMVNDYDLNPNIDTLRFYILPTMFKNNVSGTQIINDLQLIGITKGTITHALVLYLLSENDIRQAADIGNNLDYLLIILLL